MIVALPPSIDMLSILVSIILDCCCFTNKENDSIKYMLLHLCFSCLFKSLALEL